MNVSRRKFLAGTAAVTTAATAAVVATPHDGDAASGPPPSRRVDAREKVTGDLRYASDRLLPGTAHAVYAVATIGKGRLLEVNTKAAEAAPGVRLVLTRVDVKPPGFLQGGGHAFQSLQPLTSDRIAYRGQHIALVVADSLHAATEAAALITARYEAEPIAVEIDAPGAQKVRQSDVLPTAHDVVAGNAPSAFAAAPVKIDHEYESPQSHPVPMELIASVVQWDGDDLTIYEGTQNASAVQNGLALQLGISPERIEVLSPSVGGAFGQKNSLQTHLAPVAVAARRLGRPIKVVVPRTQTFHNASFRPASHHRIRLGADRSGRMLAAMHDVDQQTSRHDYFPAVYTELTSRLYGITNYGSQQNLVRTDVQTPGFMRAPYESPGTFAFESAVDELSYALGKDPVALRLANDTAVDPISGHPFSSRYLADTLRRGSRKFGWSERSAAPGSMRGRDGSLIGWGVAAGAYKAATAPATARLRLIPAGRTYHATIWVDGHEMGQGIRSAVARLVAEDLQLRLEHIEVGVGDTRGVPPQHLTAGSWGTATALPAVYAALKELRKKLGLGAKGPVPSGRGETIVLARSRAPGQPEAIHDRAAQGLPAGAGPEYPEFTAFSFVSHFVEVRVEPTTRRIRVPRVVSTVDCGKVASPRTAESQVRGGVIWGIGAALRERSEVDERFGGFANPTLEEYVVPVNADIGRIDVGLIDKPDFNLNPVGVKGLGEVVMVGVAAAVANAVFHATGRRVRHLPIRLEDVL
ncbi:xanthine dehydrogenase family protein molybdopterin-binding subunit [Actinoplanes sp. M2I2]|uniref:xanthine dehydrogenase family protein molybdopterin-binding subunit n=1 Tax=Actinoplanes sp. M2I2 TaxID=1734444 RepID=UPI0020214615|nr:xanthine dehydrogenase family protein molybdopterin-binding subunit [Actinoplanes sp. M2I2]